MPKKKESGFEVRAKQFRTRGYKRYWYLAYFSRKTGSYMGNLAGPFGSRDEATYSLQEHPA